MPVNKDFIIKYTRRKKDHDYYSACRYHIILRKAHSCPFFGSVKGNALILDKKMGGAYIDHTKLGKIISGNIFNLSKTFKNLFVKQYCVMPDHVHIFIHVTEASDKHLGKYIGILKSLISLEASNCFGREINAIDIFEPNFTDKIIFHGRNFDVISNYIQLNPHRLAMRFQFPKFFERRDIIEIDGEEFEAYGNHFLLDNPFKMVVRGHRRNTETENEKLIDECLEHVAEGGVLVSPFIHPVEKFIRERAEEMGGKLIRIEGMSFSEKFKPWDHEFNLCSEGRLLIIAPKLSIGKTGREVFMKLNGIAEKIATMESFRGTPGSTTTKANLPLHGK
ncbi:MAG: hypothetical protein J1E16_02965 [Muribaculaceae bacterium]|nr:hypothetical protein [Muribaculaceae bacterium]